MKSKWDRSDSIKTDGDMLQMANVLLDECKIVTIKTSRVYSQIARMGRQPNKIIEKMVLINALERASTKMEISGRLVSMDPPYVEMESTDIKRCFGRRVDRIIEDIVKEDHIKNTLSKNT